MIAEPPDYRAIFETAPGVVLVLDTDAPHFTMLAASDERLRVTHSHRADTIGRALFDIFSDTNPDNPEPSGVAISRDLARGMQGELTVASTPGVGSVLSLVLPAGGGQGEVLG